MLRWPVKTTESLQQNRQTLVGAGLKRGLGRYEEAAYSLWKEGRLRRRMGELCADEGNCRRCGSRLLRPLLSAGADLDKRRSLLPRKIGARR